MFRALHQHYVSTNQTTGHYGQKHSVGRLTCKATQGDAAGHGLGFFRVTPAFTTHLSHHHCGVHAVHTDLITEQNYEAYIKH